MCVRPGRPVLQVGICPAAALNLTLATPAGLLLPPAAAAAAAPGLAAAGANAVAFRPGFPALAALMAAPRPLLGAAVAAAGSALAARGWNTAVLAPGALCGDAGGGLPAPPPRVLATPSHPASGMDGTEPVYARLAWPPQADRPPDSGRNTTPRLRPQGETGAAFVAAVAAAGAAPSLAAALLPPSGVWLDATFALPPPLPARPAAAPRSCVASRPEVRDILLALVYNHGVHLKAASVEKQAALYDPFFPAVYFYGDLPGGADQPAARTFHCPGQPSAVLCTARPADMAVGRLGILWAMDDVFLHV